MLCSSITKRIPLPTRGGVSLYLLMLVWVVEDRSMVIQYVHMMVMARHHDGMMFLYHLPPPSGALYQGILVYPPLKLKLYTILCAALSMWYDMIYYYRNISYVLHIWFSKFILCLLYRLPPVPPP